MKRFVIAVALVAGFAMATGAIAQSSSSSSPPSSTGSSSADQSAPSPAGQPSPSPPSPSGQPSSPAVPPAPSGQQSGSSPADQSGVLVDASSIIGASVRSAQGKDIGKVERLMVDPKSGRVHTVVVQMGGMLGVGAKSVSMPWESVKLAQDGDRIVVSAEQQMFDQAPAASPRTDSKPENADAPKSDSKK
jgi:sporulation protein YlmC with PRC-barrel domain